MPVDDELFDDVVLQRSWPELYDHVVRRGARLRRRRRLVTVAPVLVAVAAMVVGLVVVAEDRDEAVRTGPAPSSEAPALRQRVAFVRVFNGGDGGSAIFVVDGDGSNLRRLSVDETLQDGSPAFSPDGAWIAFQSERDNPERGVRRVTDIYLMRPDGTDVRRLTTTSVPAPGNGLRHPAWSPDSARLAVAAEDAVSSRIVVLRRDGSEAEAITEGPGDVGPVWSPDGEWIAFRRRPPGAAGEELWVVRPDGTGARRVLPRLHDGSVAWTPDGSRLTYVADLPDGRTRLFTVEVDGSRPEQVSGGPGIDHLEPAWSADGELLVYSDDPDGVYLVDREVGQPPVISGGVRAGRLVVAVPGGQVVRALTQPEDGDQDRSPSLAPPDA